MAGAYLSRVLHTQLATLLNVDGIFTFLVQNSPLCYMSQFLACEMVRHPTLVTPALIIESNEIMMKSPPSIFHHHELIIMLKVENFDLQYHLTRDILMQTFTQNTTKRSINQLDDGIFAGCRAAHSVTTKSRYAPLFQIF